MPASLKEVQGQLPGTRRLLNLPEPWQPAALVLGKGLPHILLLTYLFCLHLPRNLGFSFVSCESLMVGASLILAGEVGVCLPSPLSRRQQNFWWPHHAKQTAHCHLGRELRPKLVAVVPGRTHWASAESLLACAGSRGGKEQQGAETCPLALLPCPVPLSDSHPSLGPKQLSLDQPQPPACCCHPFWGRTLPGSCAGCANLSP